jgi:HSP20 family protein
MALMQWTPMRDLQRVREEMDRLFGDVFGRGEGQEGGWHTGAWTPPVDLYETDDALVLKAELPGFTKEDLNIELRDRTLILKGERRHEREVKEEQYHRRERAYGRFQRAFMLPTVVEENKVQATFKDGVLELRLPKSEAVRPKRITITG